MINPLSSTPPASDTAAQAADATKAGKGVAAAPADGSTAGDAVTLSADAVTATQLLEAARNADGINQSAVQQLRNAVQSGTYNVSPDRLARAIVSALREAPT